MGSPAILERSGIGSAERLKKIGIPQIVDLPGVGENYQGISTLTVTSTHHWLEFILDHIAAVPAYFLDPDVKTYDALFPGDLEEIKSKNIFLYQVFAVESNIYLRTGRNMEQGWNRTFGKQVCHLIS